MVLSTAGTVAVRVARLALALASGLISARVLGATGRGEYFFIVTLAALVVQFGNLGLHASNTYYVARDRSLLPSLVGNSAAAALIVGLGGGVAVAAIAQLAYGLPLAQGIYVPLLAAPTLFYLLGTNLLVGLQRIRAYNAFELGSSLLVVSLLVTAAFVAPALTGFVGASAVAWIVAAGFLIMRLGHLAGQRPRTDVRMLRTGFRYAAKAYIAALLAFLVLRSNVFVLQAFAGSHELGLFSVATQIADVLAIAPTSVALVLFPQLVVGGEGSLSRTLRVAKIVAIGSVVAAVLTAVFAAPLIGVMFGSQFADASTILLALLPGTVALAALTVVSQYLAAIGFPRALIVSWFLALVFVVGTSVALVPVLGGVGSAVALSAGHSILLVLILAIAYRHGGAA